MERSATVTVKPNRRHIMNLQAKRSVYVILVGVAILSVCAIAFLGNYALSLVVWFKPLPQGFHIGQTSESDVVTKNDIYILRASQDTPSKSLFRFKIASILLENNKNVVVEYHTVAGKRPPSSPQFLCLDLQSGEYQHVQSRAAAIQKHEMVTGLKSGSNQPWMSLKEFRASH